MITLTLTITEIHTLITITLTLTPTRSISVGCDEESFSFTEELRLVALYDNEDENDHYEMHTSCCSKQLSCNDNENDDEND